MAEEDTVAEAERLAGKVARLRIFENDEGRFDRSLLDVSGEALVVSQFTLIADTRKGNRPSFTDAADPEVAEPLYERFCAALEAEGVRVVARRLRRADAGRARQRRARDDPPRRIVSSMRAPAAERPAQGSSRGRDPRSRISALRRTSAILPAPHFTGFTKWARRAHFC